MMNKEINKKLIFKLLKYSKSKKRLDDIVSPDDGRMQRYMFCENTRIRDKEFTLITDKQYEWSMRNAYKRAIDDVITELKFYLSKEFDEEIEEYEKDYLKDMAWWK